MCIKKPSHRSNGSSASNYSSDGFGQIADAPAIHATSAMRYKPGIDIHRVGDHTSNWVNNDEIRKNFDLILLRKWQPSRDALETVKNERHPARKRARLGNSGRATW